MGHTRGFGFLSFSFSFFVFPFVSWWYVAFRGLGSSCRVLHVGRHVASLNNSSVFHSSYMLFAAKEALHVSVLKV
jgi:hypothetical protein